MKRVWSLFLALVTLLSLCACGSDSGADSTTAATTATEPAASFLAGFGKVDITPSQLGVPMDGHGNTAERLSTGLMSYIYAIAVAVTDAEGNTAVMISVDSCGVPEAICSEVRTWAQTKFGIPKENIAISAIHQHTCPDADASNYRSELVKGLKSSLEAALDDRAPAEMYINKVQTEALNAIRRYWLNDGGFVTSHSNTGNKSSGFKDYESEADREMRLIKFTREEKDDIIMVNFQCHPHMSSGGTVTNIGSDWPGVMRDVVTEELGANVVYFSGAGGNMNSSSANKEHNVSTDWKHHGKRAAQYVIDAEEGYVKVNVGTIACKEITNTYKVDHSLDHLITSATIVAQARKKGSAYAKEVLKNYPELNSYFQASAVVSKFSLGPTIDCTISVITFGDVAFTVHPYEMFDSNGKALREGTVGNPDYAAEDQLENPFTMTFVLSKGNGGVGYIPSAIAYTHGGYEPDCTKFAAGSGELLVGDYLHLLSELYAN